MSKQDEQRLLVKIATLYYSENKKQSEIASLLHLSQSFVSRALTRCQKEGLVKITVVQPTNIFVDLEKAIEERFGIRQAIVVDVGENASYSQVKHAIGSAAARMFCGCISSTMQRIVLLQDEIPTRSSGRSRVST